MEGERPAVPEQQDFRVWSLCGLPVVSAPAEIDVANAGELREALLAVGQDQATVVLDMSQTLFCDSTALGVLIRASKGAVASGGELRLVICADSVRRIFALTGVGRMFPVFDSLDEAVAAAPVTPAAS